MMKNAFYKSIYSFLSYLYLEDKKKYYLIGRFIIKNDPHDYSYGSFGTSDNTLCLSLSCSRTFI